jgi:hypothetical protein
MIETITTSESIVFIGIISILTLTSAMIRSPVSLLFSGFTIVTFISVLAFEVQIEIFWFVAMINALMIGISLMIWTYIR